MGVVVLGTTQPQMPCAIIAAHFGARLAMGFGGTRGCIHRARGLSERERTAFGAASLPRHRRYCARASVATQLFRFVAVSIPMLVSVIGLVISHMVA